MEEIDLRATPTLQLSGPDAAENITLKLRAELERVDQDEQVVAARDAFAAAEAVFNRNHLALRRINERVGELHRFLADVAGAYVTSLIESAAADGGKPNQKIGTQIINAENEARLSTRAIGRIAEHLVPQSEIAKLRAEADFERIRAWTLDRVANERAQKLIEAMGPAIAEEVAVSVSAQGGVAGMLLGLATSARTKANSLDTLAGELEQKYREQQARKN